MGTGDACDVITNLQVTLLFVTEKTGFTLEIRQTCAAVLFGSNSNDETINSEGGDVGIPRDEKLFDDS